MSGEWPSGRDTQAKQPFKTRCGRTDEGRMRSGQLDHSGRQMPIREHSASDQAQSDQIAISSAGPPLQEARVHQGPDGRTWPEVINRRSQDIRMADNKSTTPTC